MKRLGLIAIAAVLSGCISIHEAKLDDGSLSVEIADSGWYAFGFIPLATGNPVGGGTHWFTDDVNPRTTLSLLDQILVREGATSVGPVVTREVDENVLLIFSIKTYRTSAIIPRNNSKLHKLKNVWTKLSTQF